MLFRLLDFEAWCLASSLCSMHPLLRAVSPDLEKRAESTWARLLMMAKPKIFAFGILQFLFDPSWFLLSYRVLRDV